MADKKEAPRLIPTTHLASALGLATWGSPLSVYMACRRSADFEPNPEAPERRMKAGLRGWASELLGRRFYRPRSATTAGGRLACLAGLPDGVTPEGQVALLLRMPKPGPGLDAWKVALETSELPLAERIECAALSALADWEVQVGVVFEGRLHVMKYKGDGELEAETATAAFGFFKGAVAAGKIPAAKAGDAAAFKRLYPKHTADHLRWKSLSAEQQGTVERWYLARDARLAAAKAEDELQVKVLEMVGEHSGIELGGLGHFIERVDYMAKEAGPHAGTYKHIAQIHLTKCLKPKSAAALMAQHTPEVGARSLKVYAGTGKKPGMLGGRVESAEQYEAAKLRAAELLRDNPAAGTPSFKMWQALSAEIAAYEGRS